MKFDWSVSFESLSRYKERFSDNFFSYNNSYDNLFRLHTKSSSNKNPYSTAKDNRISNNIESLE